MSPIEQVITQINESSSAILEELDSTEPSFEVIIEQLNNREKFVEKLGEYNEDYPASSFEGDELSSIKSQFDAFNKLNRSIQRKAQDLLNLQQEKLASAKRTRQAEEHYKVSQNPNISYY